MSQTLSPYPTSQYNVANDSNCTIFSADQFAELALARGANGVACFLLCTITLCVVLTLQVKRSFLDRLMLYLAVVVIFHTGLFVVQMVEEVAGEQEGFCKALGFFLEWIGWVQLATAFLVVAYQLYLLWKTVRQPYEVAAPATNPKKWHFLVLLTVWTPLPLLFVWIPLSEDSTQHHISSWCWVATIGEDCTTVGLVEEIVTWDVPLLLAGGAAGILAFLLILVYGCWACRHEHQKKQTGRHLILVLSYTAFTAMCGVELTARIHTSLFRTHHYWIWMVYAILAPWRGLALILGYALYLYPCCRACKSVVPEPRSRAGTAVSREPFFEASAYIDIEMPKPERRQLIVNIHKANPLGRAYSNPMA